MTHEKIHLIHISDSHLGPTRDFQLRGADCAARVQALVSKIKILVAEGVPVDAVIHTGDVTADGDDPQASDESIVLASQLFADLPVPLIVMNGNHDNRDTLAKYFLHETLQPFARLDEPGTGSLAGLTRLGSLWLVGLDARPDPAQDPSGYIDEAQLKQLERLLQNCQLDPAAAPESVLVYMHYPPLALDCPWLDASMLVSNGEDLHHILVRYSEQVALVLFGHIHQGLQQRVDGVLYSSVDAISCHFATWPTSLEPAFSVYPMTFFNYVTLSSSGVVIRQYPVPL